MLVGNSIYDDNNENSELLHFIEQLPVCRTISRFGSWEVVILPDPSVIFNVREFFTFFIIVLTFLRSIYVMCISSSGTVKCIWTNILTFLLLFYNLHRQKLIVLSPIKTKRINMKRYKRFKRNHDNYNITLLSLNYIYSQYES